MKPWICPECRTVYAPWVDRCLCAKEHDATDPSRLSTDRSDCERCGHPSRNHRGGKCPIPPEDFMRGEVADADRLCACGHVDWIHSPVHKACPVPGCNCSTFRANPAGRRCVRCNHSDHAHANVDGGSCQIAGCGCSDGLWVR